MSRKIVLRVFFATLVVAAIGSLINSTVATAGRLLDQTGCQRCQACGHVCNLDAEQVEVDEKCFEVESKVICIPRVVFPWQTGQSCLPFGKKKGCGSCDSCDGQGCSSCDTCVNNGARTREIRVLKSSKKKACPVCQYTWSAEEKPCATGCNTGCCDKGGCDGAYQASSESAAAPSSSIAESNGTIAAPESAQEYVAEATRLVPTTIQPTKTVVR